MKPHLPLGAVALGALLLAACRDGEAAAPASPSAQAPSASAPSASASAQPSASTAPVEGRAEGEAEAERALRRRLTPPAVPAFTIPADLLDGRDRELARTLDVPPGLYEGIAVVDARCGPGGEAGAGDAGGPAPADDEAQPTTIDHRDGGTVIRITSDRSGSYSDGTRRIVVDGDSSGTYERGALLVEVDSDGSGSYRDGRRSMEVARDGSGTYDDGEVSIEVDSDGDGRYRDRSGSVTVRDGEVEVEGAVAHPEAVARVMADGLPRFPPLPALEIPAPAPGTSCGTVLRLDANVLFDFDEAALRPDAQALLDRVAQLLVALGAPPVRVDGHTDGVGDEGYNQGLSERRAQAVVDGLAAAGVAPASMTARGLGESQPLLPEATPEGEDDPSARQLNRRVELVLIE